MHGPSAALLGFGLLTACGAGERAAPDPGTLSIAKVENGSGDTQVGVAGRPLGQDLRVVVTRGEDPAEGVTVLWTTPEGSIAPASDITGPDGISSARWTLMLHYAQQVAFATIEQGSAPAIGFTAVATPNPEAWNSVLVGPNGDNRFDPAELTITVGDTVNWVWPEGVEGHNVVPDAISPPQSGALAGYPKFHSFRFDDPGVYHYHCMAHGGAGGAGMSGVITVLPRTSRD
ncbi:MAG TPA: plastocyanin/azurin family copper-binding protein [Gemmatimonadales bacterium]|jgi:plastocyanin